MLKLFKRAVAALGLASVTLGAAPPAPQPAANPALWEVSDPDTTIYLFGTIHLLPPNYTWESPAIEQAIANSDGLYVETIVDPEHPQELVNALRTLGYSAGLPPLAERVEPKNRPLLQAAIAKTTIPPAIFDRMETWAAAFTLLGVQFKGLGLAGEDGVEMTLRQAFASAGKPVGQLETNAQQLGFFDTLPEKAQRALLLGAIQKPATASKDFNRMLNAWASGDVKEIADTFNDDLSDSPELMDALLKRRNANWSQWIEKRLDRPGTLLIAVGAGHLAGPDSVQSMLEEQGYRVRRVQ